MHRLLGVSITAVGLVALSAGFAVAQHPGATVVLEGSAYTNVAACGTPPCPSTTGERERSPTAKTKGANKKGFCPPGQANKPGKGSAFNC